MQADLEHTLHEQLAALGWSSRPSTSGLAGREVYDDRGAHVGRLTASETWALLRSRGLVAPAQHDDTAWTTDGDTSERYYRNRRLVVMDEGVGWSWQAWGGGEYEPEADGEATSEAGARHKAEAWAEQGNGPASAAARLIEDYEVAS